MKIPIKNTFFEVDEEDFEKIKDFKFYLVPCYKDISYIKCWYKKKLFYLHRFLMGVLNNNKLLIDHINGNSLDNKKCNLRTCDRSQNACNAKKRVGKTTSKYKGVYYNGSSWTSQITLKGKKIHLGCFSTEEEAANVYDLAIPKYFGEFAKPNKKP